GYYNDPEKTAKVFITVGSKRYVMPGDFATVEEDGSITLLGRGSICINSGGEKIFPEEVEAVVRSHPDVMDAIVVGAPDERWGQRVAAIVEVRQGHATPDLEAIQAHCRNHVARYKVPRQLHIVDRIQRSPAGKPDYPWANALVTSNSESATGRAKSPAGG
ncbi:MAG TPA: acyl-CoA synthetase, partial [Acidimicrobiales bacterium]|nr:acyl-CoA synthetase [Acidimicrobiales bacterium]